jgi:hypothetical protein
VFIEFKSNDHLVPSKIESTRPATTDIVTCGAFVWLLSPEIKQLEEDEVKARAALQIIMLSHE